MHRIKSVLLFAISSTASIAFAQQTLSEKIDDLASSGSSFAKHYVSQETSQALLAINGDPAFVLPELKEYILQAPSFAEQYIALELIEESSLSTVDVVSHLFPSVNYTDQLDVEAVSAIAIRLLPKSSNGPEYSYYSTYLSNNPDEQQKEFVIRWLMTQNVFNVIEDVSSRMLVGPDLVARYSEIVLAFHEIEDSVWREGHAVIPKDSMTPVAAQALDALLVAPEWWARLAAVEITARISYMTTESRKSIACADTHPIVLERAQQLGLCD